MKLKTLKDLEPKEHRCFIDLEEDCICVGMYKIMKEIKQEAIKWVKSFKDGEEWTTSQRNGAIQFGISFFNITEEDLQ